MKRLSLPYPLQVINPVQPFFPSAGRRIISNHFHPESESDQKKYSFNATPPLYNVYPTCPVGKNIYPKEHRAVRDLLRRRLLFVRQSTAHILSLQSMINRNLGLKMSNNEIKKFKPEDIESLFDCPNLMFMANNSLAAIKFLKKVSLDIEKKVKSQVKMRKEFLMLLTIPGISNILGLTISLEVGDIGRFPAAGDYSSYCRRVESKRVSNGKKILVNRCNRKKKKSRPS